MARRCDICSKGQATGSHVSHALNHTKRTFRPNIQRIRVNVDGKPVKKNVCTRCIRSGRITKAL